MNWEYGLMAEYMPNILEVLGSISSTVRERKGKRNKGRKKKGREKKGKENS